MKELQKENVDLQVTLDNQKSSEVSPSFVESQKKLLNAKMEENFSLKNIIDTKRVESDKLKKRHETLEDQYQARKGEFDGALRDLKEAQL